MDSANVSLGENSLENIVQQLTFFIKTDTSHSQGCSLMATLTVTFGNKQRCHKSAGFYLLIRSNNKEKQKPKGCLEQT